MWFEYFRRESQNLKVFLAPYINKNPNSNGNGKALGLFQKLAMENNTSEEKSFLGNTAREEGAMKSNGEEESTSMEIDKVISFTYLQNFATMVSNLIC